jgi:hypothetical protein
MFKGTGAISNPSRILESELPPRSCALPLGELITTPASASPAHASVAPNRQNFSNDFTGFFLFDSLCGEPKLSWDTEEELFVALGLINVAIWLSRLEKISSSQRPAWERFRQAVPPVNGTAKKPL